jgi:hypothetical protein
LNGECAGFTDEGGEVGAYVAVGFGGDGFEVGGGDGMGDVGEEDLKDGEAGDSVGDACETRGRSQGQSVGVGKRKGKGGKQEEERRGSIPISISLSNLPGRLNAGSIAFGLFVAPMTTILSSSSSSSPSSPSSLFPPLPIPSINVNNCATTLFSTSPPPSSLFGHNASISSMTKTHGLLLFASSHTPLNFSSVSPWKLPLSSGPLITMHEQPGEEEGEVD